MQVWINQNNGDRFEIIERNGLHTDVYRNGVRVAEVDSVKAGERVVRWWIDGCPA